MTSDIHKQVSEFHKAFDFPRANKPTVLSRARTQFRLRIIAEEFVELLGAAGCRTIDIADTIDYEIERGCDPDGADLVEIADACADIDYTVEGLRSEMGIDGKPIADEVHRSNMAKLGGETRDDGKRLKPPGWTPPDIAGCLRKQGWEG